MIRQATALLLPFSFVCISFAQSTTTTAAASDSANTKASAYYNFAMGRMYAELAGSYGNRSEYVTKAIDHYRQALKLDPGATFVFEELSDLLIQTGRLRDAITEAEDALKRSPDNLDARRILARIYYRMIGDAQQGRVSEEMVRRATEQYQKITEKDPKDAESWVSLGRLYRVSNNSVEAEKAFNQALKADPDNEDALTGLAVIYSDLGDTKKAIEKLRAVTDRNPSAHTLAALASAYEQSRDFKSAAEVLRKALDDAPDNARIQAALARDLFYSEQYDDSLKLYEQIAARDPRDAETQLRMSQLYRAKRDLVKARETLEKAKKLDPQNIEVRYDEVSLLEAESKPDQAIAVIKSILADTTRRSYSAAETGNRAMFLERLGTLYRSTNQYQPAVDTFRQLENLDKEAAPRAAVQIVETWRAAKDNAKALQEADAAVKNYPDDRAVRLAHATVIADMGKVDEAAAEVRGTMKGDRDRETLLALAQIYDRAKRFDDMSKTLDEAEKISTTPADKEGVWFMRGAMYERMKKYDNAEAAFRKVLELNANNAGALNYLGYMFADRDVRLDEAAKLVSRALELEPGNGAYLDSLGWVYYRQGRLGDAENMLVQALERIGKDPTVHDHLGDVYFKQGKTKDAINQWQASLSDFQSGAGVDTDPEEMAKVSRKLESAKVRLAKETGAKE